MKLSEEEKKQRSEQRREEQYNKTHKIINNLIYKKCNKHNIYFPDEDGWLPCTEEYFSRSKHNAIDELYPYCKRCNSRKSVDWWHNNKKQHELDHKKYENGELVGWNIKKSRVS